MYARRKTTQVSVPTFDLTPPPPVSPAAPEPEPVIEENRNPWGTPQCRWVDDVNLPDADTQILRKEEWYECTDDRTKCCNINTRDRHPVCGSYPGLTQDTCQRPGTQPPPPPPPLPGSTISVVIVAGQSNAVGFGTGRPDDWIPNTVIYTNLGEQRSWNPLGPRSNDNMFGPEVEFARNWMAYRGTPLAVIKIAAGATGFGTGEWPARHGNLYQELLRGIGAVSSLPGPARFAAACWYQGENDAVIGHENYFNNLSTFIRALREDTGVPSLPFVATLINCTWPWPHCHEVRAATVQVANTLADVKVVDANDLPVRPGDEGHLSDQGVREVGARMYRAIFG